MPAHPTRRPQQARRIDELLQEQPQERGREDHHEHFESDGTRKGRAASAAERAPAPAMAPVTALADDDDEADLDALE